MDFAEARETLGKLVSEAGLAFDCQPVDERTDGMRDWPKGWFHWRFTATAPNGATYRGGYSAGVGAVAMMAERQGFKAKYPKYGALTEAEFRRLVGGGWQRSRLSLAEESAFAEIKRQWRKNVSPDVTDIISSLAMDAANSDQSFSDWCAEYGYSDDSIKAKAVWETCNEARRFLERAFGDRIGLLYEAAYAM